MRVLIIGSGGREHALACSLAASPLLTKLYVAPGNAGTAEMAENVAIGVVDVPALVAFAQAHQVDLVLPGPEAPLVAGIADALAEVGIRCCGPTAAAAQLEGSKAFTKEIADAARVPTAAWERFDDAQAAHEFIRRKGAPIVVKADGLAAGKGVVVAETEAEAHEAITAMMEDASLGEAGASVVIEECLTGPELSLFALCDGLTAIPLGVAQDHKRVGEGDTGPNTGGMGAISPPPIATPALIEDVMSRIIRPTLHEMHARGTPFRGILFAGLMLTSQGPKLIEYNVRFGDPECETLLPRLRSDLLPALLAACDGELADFDLQWKDLASAVVIMAAKGYPGDYARHTPIGDLAAASKIEGVRIFHAGTERREGQLVSTGGRVLAVCGTGADLRQALARAYQAIDLIDWPQGFCRRDIGHHAIGER
jgi:phosphoribosylamine--glycine ligase